MIRGVIITTFTLLIILSTLTLCITCAQLESSTTKQLLLEPIVKKHVGILPPDVCRELIRLGEEEGFTVEHESIDNYEEGYTVPSQSIEIFERDDGITSPAIWNVLEPFIPQLTELVKQSIDTRTDVMYYPDKQPDRVPQLGWVFYRKYSPDTPRNSLKLHVDSNMHTLNIALNDDFRGGGLFYVKPPAEQEEDLEDDRPVVPDEYITYDWLNNLKRENTSDLIFPTLGAGDVLIHNFTVWHAVAPIESGSRYSFVLFYDLDNPAIQNDYLDEDEFDVVFYHQYEDMGIDLVWVDDTNEGEEGIQMVEQNMQPFQDYTLGTYDGHLFKAFVSGTEEVLSEFVMREDQERYNILIEKKEDSTNDEL